MQQRLCVSFLFNISEYIYANCDGINCLAVVIDGKRIESKFCTTYFIVHLIN